MTVSGCNGIVGELEVKLAECHLELVEALETLLVSCSHEEDGWLDTMGHPGAVWAGERLVGMGLWERRTFFKGGAGMDRQWYRKIAGPDMGQYRG
jgi:hypothetical protein